MPNRFRLPPELKEAMLIIETGFPPDVLDRIPEETLQKMQIYSNVKKVHEFGGEYTP